MVILWSPRTKKHEICLLVHYGAPMEPLFLAIGQTFWPNLFRRSMAEWLRGSQFWGGSAASFLRCSPYFHLRFWWMTFTSCLVFHAEGLKENGFAHHRYCCSKQLWGSYPTVIKTHFALGRDDRYLKFYEGQGHMALLGPAAYVAPKLHKEVIHLRCVEIPAEPAYLRLTFVASRACMTWARTLSRKSWMNFARDFVVIFQWQNPRDGWMMVVNRRRWAARST